MAARGKYTVIVALLCTLFFFGCEEKGAESSDTSAYVKSEKGYVSTEGDVSVPFTVTTFSGDPFNLAESAGHPVVINMWASWCGPCKLEAPDLQRAYQTYKDSGVLFLGVALQDSVENSMAFIKRYGWSFPSGPDDTGEIMKAYRVMAIPMTFIVDGGGVVSYIHVGPIDEYTVARELDRLL